VRILFLHRDLPPDTYTGVAIQVHRLANALVDLGHSVDVLTLSAGPADARYRVLRIDDPALRRAVRLAPFLKRLWYPLWYSRRDFRGYDAVHVHGDGGFLRYRGNFVRTFYGTAGMEFRHARSIKGRIAQGFSFWMERRESRRCRLCVGISPHIAEFLPQVGHVVPCMLPGDPDAEPPGLSAKTAHPSLIFLGSRFSRKRGELALELFRRLRPAFRGLRMTYVGPAAETAALRDAPGTEGIDFRSGVGQEELDRLYRGAWVYLCLSSYEGFGVGLIEAMARSCVVLTTPHPGSDYLVRDGETGLVAAPEVAEGVLARILADTGARAALASRGREAARRFAPSAVAASYVRLYEAASAGREAEDGREDAVGGRAAWA
jgi:glycosyltransferase involved in cell wall biosynthesis